MNNTIIIIDYGSQYTQLIARRIRELNVHSIILPYDFKDEQISKYNVSGFILSGGPSSVYEKKAPFLPPRIFDYKVPIFGICYGFQLLIENFNGLVVGSNKAEYGNASIKFKQLSLLFNDIPKKTTVWMSHGDKVVDLPQDWNITSESDNGIISSSENEKLRCYGVQFHPEVIHTLDGEKIIENFLFKICNVIPNWTSKNFIDHSIKKIREIVGDKKVLCALSGGVDSTVVAAILSRAIGDNVTCIFIDHGMLRKNEAKDVMDMYSNNLQLNVKLCDESQLFLDALEGVVDPEKKRKIIGNKFIESFENITKNLNDFHFLAQGTLYPDIIESGGYGKVADKIKSHHNVGGLPEKMKLKLIEPLNELFKDEVRHVGRELMIPENFIMRHPFPGPGLAVRILGKITNKRIDILQEADFIFINILKETGHYNKIWQAFTVLLPVKTVGVMGDKRTYDNVICLRMVTSVDGMTADWYDLPSEVLKTCSSRIVNEVKGVNRVVLDITSKPPGTIEWE